MTTHDERDRYLRKPLTHREIELYRERDAEEADRTEREQADRIATINAIPCQEQNREEIQT